MEIRYRYRVQTPVKETSPIQSVHFANNSLLKAEIQSSNVFLALFPGAVKRWVFPGNESTSDDENVGKIKRLNDEVARLDEYENRLQLVEEQLNINGNVQKLNPSH